MGQAVARNTSYSGDNLEHASRRCVEDESADLIHRDPPAPSVHRFRFNGQAVYVIPLE